MRCGVKVDQIRGKAPDEYICKAAQIHCGGDRGVAKADDRRKFRRPMIDVTSRSIILPGV